MPGRVGAWLAAMTLLCLASADVAAQTTPGADKAAGPSWWEQYTPVVTAGGENRDWDQAAAGAARNVGYPAGWYGFWFRDDQQRIGVGRQSWQRAGQAGLRRLIYYDSGEAGDYAAFFDAAGKVVCNGWSLPWWKGEPVTARWFGLAAFMADVPWAPWPTAKQYSLPPFTRPDGTPPDDLYEVLARRNLAGQWKFDHFSNPRVSDDAARRSGLAGLTERQTAAAEVAGKSGWQTVRLVHLDFANPQLREFRCRELAREIVEQRPDGVHIDNHGDLNTLYPQIQGFGLWSLHAFRQWLKRRATPSQQAEWGIADPERFDIRDHLRTKRLEPPPGPAGRWTHHAWTEDRLWNCYVLSLAEAGLDFHRAVYRAAKDAARQAGLDGLVAGNLIPGFPGHELLAGSCDVAHFEWRAVGRLGPLRGVGLPPWGRAAYVVRLGAAISRAGYCWPSIYVPKDLAGPGHENLHKLLAFDCLANHGLLDFGHWYLDGYSPGTPQSAAFVNRFVAANAPRASGRRFVADVGLVYCPWSALAAVGVARAFNELLFDEYAGWATYLAHRRRAWDVVLSTDLSPERLQQYPVLVLPSVSVLTDEQVAALERYARAGARLVATGGTGARWGPDRFLELRPTGALAGLSSARLVPSTPGRQYWNHDRDPAAAAEMDGLLRFDAPGARLTTDAPPTVGVVLSRSAGRDPLWMVDLTNFDLDAASDRLRAAPESQVTLQLPAAWARRALDVTYVEPDGPAANTQRPLPSAQWRIARDAGGGDSLTMRLPGFLHAMIVYVGPAERAGP